MTIFKSKRENMNNIKIKLTRSNLYNIEFEILNLFKTKEDNNNCVETSMRVELSKLLGFYVCFLSPFPLLQHNDSLFHDILSIIIINYSLFCNQTTADIIDIFMLEIN